MLLEVFFSRWVTHFFWRPSPYCKSDQFLVWVRHDSSSVSSLCDHDIYQVEHGRLTRLRLCDHLYAISCSGLQKKTKCPSLHLVLSAQTLRVLVRTSNVQKIRRRSVNRFLTRPSTNHCVLDVCRNEGTKWGTFQERCVPLLLTVQSQRSVLICLILLQSNAGVKVCVLLVNKSSFATSAWMHFGFVQSPVEDLHSADSEIVCWQCWGKVITDVNFSRLCHYASGSLSSYISRRRIMIAETKRAGSLYRLSMHKSS